MIRFNRMAAVALLVTTSLGSWAAGEATTPGTWEKVKTFTHQQQKEAVAEGKKLMAATDKQIATPVSYTHLDVYKRQQRR